MCPSHFSQESLSSQFLLVSVNTACLDNPKRLIKATDGSGAFRSWPVSNDCSHTLGISCDKPSKPSATAERLPAVNCCYKEFQYRCYRVGVVVHRSTSENLSCFLKRYAKSFVYTQFYSHFASAYFSTYSNVGNSVVSNARPVAQNFMLLPV